MTENNSENNIPQKENIASQNKTISYIKKNPLVIVISFIAILFFIFAAFQFFAPDNLKPIKSNSNKESSSNTNTNKSESKGGEDGNKVAGSTTTQNSNSTTSKGTIKGNLAYPTDALVPGQKVCAQNISTKEETCITTKVQAKEYTLSVIPGDYYVLVKATIDSDGNESPNAAYYNQFVTDCISKNYTDPKCLGDAVPESYHTNYVKVTVEANKTVENINPTDWYYIPANYNSTSATNSATYTNPYFPNFKLVYDKSWKFSTVTRDSTIYPGLADRSIDLTKGNLHFNITLMAGVGGCGGGGMAKNVQEFSNGLKRFTLTSIDQNGKTLDDNGYINYSSDASEGGGCGLDFLTSNIDSKSNTTYKSRFPDDTKIRFHYIIETGKNVKSLNNGTSGYSSDPVKITDTDILKESDKIISDSTFN